MRRLVPSFRRRALAIAISGCLVGATSACAGGASAAAARPEVEGASFEVVGAEAVVFDWSEDACDPADIPDIPARAFRDANGHVQLLSAHYVSRRARGSSLDTVKHECRVVMDSHHNPKPSAFDDKEWIASTYTTNGRTVYAIVHMEYQGHTHLVSRCPSGDYLKCWWNTLNLGVSRDGGRTYRHAKPPNHLIAASIRRYFPDAGVFGMFGPSNVVRHTDGFYYVFFTQHIGATEASRGLTGTCVMRTRSLDRPRSWRAWDGGRFAIRFADPYRQQATRLNACVPLAQDALWNWNLNVTFNTYLGRYVAVGSDESVNAETGRREGWVTLSTSPDLVHWTVRRKVLRVEFPSTWEQGDEPAMAYPVVLDPLSPSRNFQTVGQRAYLYFTRFNNFGYDRDLLRAPIEFSNG